MGFAAKNRTNPADFYGEQSKVYGNGGRGIEDFRKIDRIVTVGGYSFNVTELSDSILLSDLKGSGTITDLMKILRNIPRDSDKPIYITIDCENPDMERLMSIYTKRGFKTYTVVMVRE